MNNKNLDEIAEVKAIRVWKDGHADNPFKYTIPSNDLFSAE
jgi:hypothetical protein